MGKSHFVPWCSIISYHFTWDPHHFPLEKSALPPMAGLRQLVPLLAVGLLKPWQLLERARRWWPLDLGDQPWFINWGGYSSNSHNPILFYGTSPINQPFGGLLIQGWHYEPSLVGGLNPLNNMFVSWDYDIPNVWKVTIHSCSKPPTRSKSWGTQFWLIGAVSWRFMNPSDYGFIDMKQSKAKYGGTTSRRTMKHTVILQTTRREVHLKETRV